MTDDDGGLYKRVLILRCQAGDEIAFAELVANYSPRLSYFLRMLIGDNHDADDLLQDVWFDVFTDLPKLADPAAFPAWLYRVARNRAFRRLRWVRTVYPSAPDDQWPGQSDREEEFTFDDAAWVHAALDRLPPEQREVLVLRFLEDLAYEDVASIVGCPLGTIKSRIYHAKRGLRRAIEQSKGKP